MTSASFSVARLPKIIFGPGTRSRLPELIKPFGTRILLVHGEHSLNARGYKTALLQSLHQANLEVVSYTVNAEPSPALVDNAVYMYAQHPIDAVVAIGGGSVLDAGKAISAMLPLKVTVRDFLEGVGTRLHPGLKRPFIAVPTTAGTGTEATKNASLSEVGPQGFKNSLRHDHFVPEIALIDPELALSCPPAVTAACGMDALAQLLESLVSPQASPFTDALALSGLKHAAQALIPACTSDNDNLEARTHMAYAALLSGITLANAGLGIVHSLSPVLGGLLTIPHGIICGTLLAEGTRLNLKTLFETAPMSPAVKKHAEAGRILSGQADLDDTAACQALLAHLEAWTQILAMPRLGAFGLTPAQIPPLLPKAAMRNNPVALNPQDIHALLLSRL